MDNADDTPTAHQEYLWEYNNKKVAVSTVRFFMTVFFPLAPHRLSMKQYKEAVLIAFSVALTLYASAHWNDEAILAALPLLIGEHFFLKRNVEQYNQDLEKTLKHKWGLS